MSRRIRAKPVTYYGKTMRFLCMLTIGSALLATAADLPALRVSENRRFLITADGKPFFWLGDTAWELFHRLDRAEADHYLKDRAAKGFTVIQAVALAEFGGLTVPNPYGHLPLVDKDPLQPIEAYWRHVDHVVRRANELGLYIGFLPTWGDKWNKAWGEGPEIFTPANAEAYGEWLGKRYRNAGLIWILGGDRAIATDAHLEILSAMARGLKRGDGGAHLMTFHPTGGRGSSELLHNEAWLDFNMRQNGHTAEHTNRYDKTRADYDLKHPVKPVLDGEPIYEDHPVNFRQGEFGHSIASDVRRPLYWNLFAGAFGHTYGHHSVWQMFSPGVRPPVNDPLLPWKEALQQPGAKQMQYGRWLMESRPFLTRIPDDSVIVTDVVRTKIPGAGRYRFVGTRDEAGTFAMVYAPVGRPFAVDMSKLKGAHVKAWWFNPRNGAAVAIGVFPNQGQRMFTPPDAGEMLDWVLVLDDASKGYSAPGARKPAAR
jgi:hypothetical protein